MSAIPLRPLGKTGLQVSALSLGTVGLGLQYGIAADSGNLPPAHDDAVQLVRRAIAVGVTFIDTARGYGTSEQVVGDAIADQRDRVQIVTKVNALDGNRQPLRGDALRQRIEESMKESLRNLRTDRVDVLMLHSAPLELLHDGEALTVLRELQEWGYDPVRSARQLTALRHRCWHLSKARKSCKSPITPSISGWRTRCSRARRHSARGLSCARSI